MSSGLVSSQVLGHSARLEGSPDSATGPTTPVWKSQTAGIRSTDREASSGGHPSFCSTVSRCSSGARAQLIGRFTLLVGSGPLTRCTTPRCYTEIATRHLVPRFVYYWATQLPYSYWLTSTALPSMTQSGLSAAKIPYISIEDQDAIVAFLDRETAEIDAFIADQEELIGLLAERRAAAVDVLLRQDDGKGIRNMIQLGWAFDFLNGDRGSDYPDRRDFVESGVPVTCSTACVDQLVRTQSFVGPVEVRWHHRWWRYGLGRERSIAATRSGYSIRGWNDTRGCC